MKKNKLFPEYLECTVAVVGLGYVGLPLAINFAKNKFLSEDNKSSNRKVIGFDIDSKRVNELNNFVDFNNEISEEDLRNSKTISFTSDENELYKADVFIVTVPTPVDESKKPNFRPLKESSKTIAKVIGNKKKYQKNSRPIIIYESTVYPGVTEEICVPIISKLSGLKLNKDFFCGYSPERINPGDKSLSIEKIIKITSGSSKECANWVDNLYKQIIKAGTFKAPSIKVAEAAKIIENIQRDLNIAIMNEFAMIFDKIGIDTLDVLQAAETKWNFIPFKPGLVGGHCISVDPYYLAYKSQKIGFIPEFINTGRRINDSMSEWIVNKIVRNMIINNISVKESNALILGFSFKENCNDFRNTKVRDLILNLEELQVNTTIVDPYVCAESVFEKFQLNVLKNIPKKDKFDAVICLVSHDEFKLVPLETWLELIEGNGIFFDLKGILPKELNPLRI